MADTLSHLHDTYGQTATYLKGIGLSERQIEALRARLLS